jgi:hypothetical protein
MKKTIVNIDRLKGTPIRFHGIFPLLPNIHITTAKETQKMETRSLNLRLNLKI